METYKREDFKIAANYYSTNELTFILHKDKPIHYVEIYKDLYFLEVEKDNWKSQKKKRSKEEVQRECEAYINKLLK